MNVKIEHPHLAYPKGSTLSILPIGRGPGENLGKLHAFLINWSYDTGEKKKNKTPQQMLSQPSGRKSLLQLRNSRTSFHPPWGSWCWWAACTATLFLGKPEQAKGTAPLFTASFLPHTVLTRKPQQTITVPLVCAAKLLLEAGTCGLPDLGLSTPQLSCPLIFLFHVAPLCLPAVGHLSHSMQVTCIPSRIREVSTPGKVGLVRFRPLHSQNTTWTEGKG